MTSDTTSRVPGLRFAHPALSRCIGTEKEAFARDTWGREPLLTRAADLPAPFDDLLSAAAVDELVSRRGLRTPFLRVARAGSTLPSRDFTSGGGVGAAATDQVSDDKLAALFSEGATLVLQGLHRTWPPLVSFSQDIAAELGHPVQVNAYVTPPQSQGFSDHYDVHDVFVLQVEGEKRWMIRPPVHESPLRDQPWTDRKDAVARAAQEEPLLDVVLRPGDALYLPRGFLHAATAQGDVSIHLTVGVHTWTRHALAKEVAREVLRRLADDVTLRASLPLGIDVGAAEMVADELTLVHDAMAKALVDLDVDRVHAAMAGRSRDGQRAAPLEPLAQVRASREAGDETCVVLRGHVAASLRFEGEQLVVLSRAGRVAVGAQHQDALHMLLSGLPVRVAELPGEQPAALDLVRRLLAAGVVVPA